MLKERNWMLFSTTFVYTECGEGWASHSLCTDSTDNNNNYMTKRLEMRLLWEGSDMWSTRFCMGPLPVTAACA